MESTTGFVRQQLIVGFGDLSHFLVATEGRDSLEVASAMQRHYERVGHVVTSHGGRVVKFIGDAVLFCFPQGQERAALDCALEMQAAVASGIANELQCETMRLCVGLASGEAVAGDLGTQTEKRFDILGEAVNSAALICHGEGIRITEGVRACLGDAVATVALPPIRHAGREIAVWQIG